MNKKLTKIVGVALGLSMAVGVGAGIVTSNKQASPVYAEPIEVFSFSRSGSSDTVSNGYSMVLTNYKGNADNYQDKNASVGLDIGVKKAEGTIWTETPTSISLTVKVGGGSTRNPLNNNVIANLIDSSGSAIAGTDVTVTTKVETTTGKNYTVSVPVANNAAGVMIHHEKESSYNVRIYEISLSYVAAGGQAPAPSLTITAPTYMVDGTTATISGTISNDNNYTITWSANDANVSFSPASSSSGANVTMEFDGVTTGTTPIVITGTLNNDGDAVTGTESIYALAHAGTQADPFSATDAQVFSHTNYASQSGGDWYVKGYVVSIYNQNSLDKGYYIDEDAENTSSRKFEVFNNSGVTNNTGNGVVQGSLIVAHGSMTCFNNSQSEITSSIIISVDNSEVNQDSVSLSISTASLNLDLNGSSTGSLTVTAATTGEATKGLSAVSDNESVATVSTGTPTSGVAFTVTAEDTGTAHITITSTWDPNESVVCTVTVVDTTPRLANFKKIDSLVSGQHVLITSVVDGDYYSLPSTQSTADAPSAISCTYDFVHDRILNADANKTFIVSGNSSGWQFISESGDYLYISGNDNNRIRVGNTSHSFTVHETTNGFYVQSTSFTRYLGVYQKTDWRCYNSREAGNYQWSTDATEYNCDWINFWVEAKPDQTISGATVAYTDETVTLTSTAASPKWSIVAGDTTAAGASVTAAGVVSVTGAGTVKVKASHDDYEDAFHTITFSVRPVEPFINPSANSINGRTGQKETISFLYGNLNGTLNIVSNNNSVASIDTPSYSAGSGTVNVKLVGVGSTTISFKDGSTELSSISVSVADYIKTTFIAGTDVGSSTESISKAAITISTAEGEGTFVRNDNYRVYSGKEVVISSSKGNITKIEFNCTSDGYNPLSGSGYTKDAANGVWTGDAPSVTLTASGNQARITKIIVTIKATSLADVRNTESLSALKFDYTDIDDIYSFTNTAIRFGGFISKAKWDALDAEAGITGYGILVAPNSNLGGQTIEQKYDSAKTNNNTPEEAINSICSTYGIGKKIIKDKDNPAVASPEQKEFMGVTGDYYIWTVKKSIGDAFTTKYNALAFILIDDDIVFLDEVSYSAKDIATRDVPNTDAADPALPALTWIKDH